MEQETSSEMIRHDFTEQERREIATEMAQYVSEHQKTDDERKAIQSQYKSRLDELQAKINLAASNLNSGYEMRRMECLVERDYDKKRIVYRDPDTLEIVKERPMHPSDRQMRLDDQAA